MLRRYSSADPVPAIPDPPSAPWPIYWYRPAHPLSTQAGMHRFLWDVHLQPLGAGAAAGGGLGAVPTQLPIQAIPYNSPTAATTPWAAPGTYTIELTVEGKTYSQPIVVKQDPRVKTPALEMQKVYALTSALYFGAADAQAAASTLGGTAGPAHRDVVSGTGCDGAGDRRVREEGGSAGRDTASGGGGREGVAAEERPHRISRRPRERDAVAPPPPATRCGRRLPR